jgi:hypothetical protein
LGRPWGDRDLGSLSPPRLSCPTSLSETITSRFFLLAAFSASSCTHDRRAQAASPRAHGPRHAPGCVGRVGAEAVNAARALGAATGRGLVGAGPWPSSSTRWPSVSGPSSSPRRSSIGPAPSRPTEYKILSPSYAQPNGASGNSCWICGASSVNIRRLTCRGSPRFRHGTRPSSRGALARRSGGRSGRRRDAPARSSSRG